uniref:Heparinase II/III-like C-terminal domain-containing protein n=1 Tax=Alexandrium monilatum TaxID=311494 RepID=A0A7S4URJ9_9DINO
MYTIAAGKNFGDIAWADMWRLKLRYTPHCQLLLSEVRLIAPVTSRLILPSYSYACCDSSRHINDLEAVGGDVDLSAMLDHSTGLLRPNTVLSMTVTLEHARQAPTYFRYTKDVKTSGFAFKIKPAKYWLTGDNHVTVLITPGMYQLAKGASASSIPWASMSRLQIDGDGAFNISNVVLRSGACQVGQVYVPWALAPECQDYGCCLRPPGDLPTSLVALKAHPRVRLNSEDFARLRELTRTDTFARHYCARLIAHAESILADQNRGKIIGGLCAPVKGSLLEASRTALDRIATLSLAFRLSSGRHVPCGQPVKDSTAFAKEAIVYMMGATEASCLSWSHRTFPDAAQMLHAISLGYDWLFEELSPAQRLSIEQGAFRLGLRPGLAAFGAWNSGSWPLWDSSWNLVCNGALLAGAMAFGDAGDFYHRETAAEVYRQALTYIHIGLGSYAPDGGWFEGPANWARATEYAVVALSSLSTALGTDGGLSKSPGFAQTGMFRIDAAGPAGFGHLFNFGDSEQAREETWRSDVPIMFGLAQVLAGTSEDLSGAYAAWAREKLPSGARFSCDAMACANAMLMYTAKGAEEQLMEAERPVSRYRMPGGRGDDIGFIRPTWKDPEAPWLGFKGGWARRSHADADAGTFVLDMAGQHFVIDLGMENHEIPGVLSWYLSNDQGRSHLYRTTTCGHNTLTFDSDCTGDASALSSSNQLVDAVAPMLVLSSGVNQSSWSPQVTMQALSGISSNPFGVINLTPVYPRATAIARGFRFADAFQQLLVVDQIRNDNARTATWAIHTKAMVSMVQSELFKGVDRGHCVLRQEDAYIHARIIEPPGAGFDLSAVALRPPEFSARGVRRLSITVDLLSAERTTLIAVAFGTTDRSTEWLRRVLQEVGEPLAWAGANATV